MKNRLATLVGALALSAAASAQTWIWYPGDYEIWLGLRSMLLYCRHRLGYGTPAIMKYGWVTG